MKFVSIALLAVVLVVTTGAVSHAFYSSGNDGITNWESYQNVDTSPPAPTPGPGYGFRYESMVQYAMVNPSIDGWDYDWYLENNSTTHQIISWTWSYSIYSGNLLAASPNPTLAGGWRFGSVLSLALPVANGSVNPPAEWCEELAAGYPSPHMTVWSTITWDDAHSEQWQVFVPMELVPEPGSLVALAGSLAGFAMLRRRAR